MMSIYKFSPFILMGCLMFGQAEDTQKGAECLRVESASVPIYPPNARLGIQGVVKLRVATDGVRIKKIGKISGHPMLVQSAIKCVESWCFEKHSPLEFVTTFEYVISKEAHKQSKSDEIYLELPTIVRIKSYRIMISDPATETK